MDDKLNLKSLDIKEDKIQQLKKAFPGVVSEGKVDLEKLKSELGEEVAVGKERYEMRWPGKANLQKIIQEPSIGTLKPVKDSSVDFDSTENLFIEGDSLEVLKLLQKSYYGKVKMIYIDPPYNTGNDFIYPDNYSESLDTYLRYTGQKGEEGLKLTTNAETEGRYHSKWMNMIYPRLFLARNLLKDDGVVFISIDDHEADNLKKICNEIFGEENFVTEFVWQKSAGAQNDSNYAAINHEYIFAYCKNIEAFKYFKLPPTEEMLRQYSLSDEYVNTRGKHQLRALNDFSIGDRPGLHYDIICPDGSILKGNENRWRCDKNRFEWRLKENRIVFKENENKWQVFYKNYINETKEQIIKDANGDLLSYGKIPESLLLKVAFTGDGKKDLDDLFEKSIFSYPKPVKLLIHLLTTSMRSGDLIIDFFAGSASTAHAVLELNKNDGGNRKYIMVQLQEPTAEDSEAFKVGYKNIAEIGEERIRRVIKKIKDEKEGKLDFDGKELDLGFKVFRLEESNFKIWDKKSDAPLQEQLQLSVSNINDDSSDEEILYEIILKSGFELSVFVEKLDIQGKIVYSVDNKSLLICLENDLSQEFIKEVANLGGARVVFLDRGFNGNDQIKTNTVELMKAKGVEFKTV